MRQVVRRSVLAALAAGGLVLTGTGLVQADSAMEGLASGSPGFVSGNVVHVPIHVPVNVCAESVNVVGLLNPASGRTCSAD
jgi:hypothetical protein